jgi:hypothetical protein
MSTTKMTFPRLQHAARSTATASSSTQAEEPPTPQEAQPVDNKFSVRVIKNPTREEEL